MQKNTRQFIFISTQDPSVAGKGEDSSAYDPYLTGDGCVWSKGSKVINRFWQLILPTLSSITVCHWSGSFRTGSQGHYVLFSQGKFTDTT